MDSILTSVKKMLGIEAEYNHFDNDIIMHINSTFTILNQLGVGPSEGFSISNSDAVWTDFISSIGALEIVRSYMYLRVKLLFDPPQSSAHIEAINNQIKEFEFRMNVAVDPEVKT